MTKRRIGIVCLLLTICMLAPFTKGELLAFRPSRTQAIAWEQQGSVQLAIANTSLETQWFTARFGYYLLGRRIVQNVTMEVPPKTIHVTTHPVVRDESGGRTADTVFVEDSDGRQVATAYINGLHPATDHYLVERYLIRAGQAAVTYIKAPNPELGSDTKIYLSIGKTFNLGNYTGKLKVDRVYDGGLEKESKPPFGEGEPRDFYNYSYGWRGLRITAPTPELVGVEQLDFAIEEFISTPEGTARHGLSTPPILVYGPDMTLMEK